MASRKGGGDAADQKMSWKVGLRLIDFSVLAEQMYCKFCRAILDLNRIQDEKMVGFACELSIECHCGRRNEVQTSPAEYTDSMQIAFEINVKAASSMKKRKMPVHHLCNFFQDLTIPFGLDHDHKQCAQSATADQQMFESGMMREGGTDRMFDSDDDNDAGMGELPFGGDSDASDTGAPNIKQERDDSASFSHAEQASTSTSGRTPATRRSRKRKHDDADLPDVTHVPNTAIQSETGFLCGLCKINFAKFRSLYMHQTKEHGLDYAREQKALLLGDAKTTYSKKGKQGVGKTTTPGRGRGRRKTTTPPKTKTQTRKSARGGPKSKRKPKDDEDDEDTDVGDDDADYLPVAFRSQQVTVAPPHTCSVCSESFDRPGKLREHMKKHTHPEPFTCQSCSKTFASERTLDEHERVQHSDDFPYACGKCNEKFKATQYLIRHMKSKHRDAGTGKFVMTKTKQGLVAGLQAKKAGNAGETSGASAVARTVKFGSGSKEVEEMLSDPTNLQCTVCSAVFPSTRSLLHHKRMHDDNIDIYKCTKCEGDKRFRFKKDLVAHLQKDHDVRLSYSCYICGKFFSTYGALYKHKQIHTETKKFQCGTCGKMFVHLETLCRHERTHVKGHAYKCGICSKGYHDLPKLHRHMATHKEHSCFKKDGPIICHKCGKTLSCRSSLHVHLMTHSVMWHSKTDLQTSHSIRTEPREADFDSSTVKRTSHPSLTELETTSQPIETELGEADFNPSTLERTSHPAMTELETTSGKTEPRDADFNVFAVETTSLPTKMEREKTSHLKKSEAREAGLNPSTVDSTSLPTKTLHPKKNETEEADFNPSTVDAMKMETEEADFSISTLETTSHAMKTELETTSKLVTTEPGQVDFYPSTLETSTGSETSVARQTSDDGQSLDLRQTSEEEQKSDRRQTSEKRQKLKSRQRSDKIQTDGGQTSDIRQTLVGRQTDTRQTIDDEQTLDGGETSDRKPTLDDTSGRTTSDDEHTSQGGQMSDRKPSSDDGETPEGSQTPEGKHQCPVCLKEVKSIVAHRRRCHGYGAGYRYRCDICDKPFMTPDDYESHLNGHQGVKPFQCELCKKRFQSRRTIMRHICPKDNASAPHMCGVCGKGFREGRLLQQHSLSHDKTPQFECPHCGKTFKQPQGVSRHVKSRCPVLFVSPK